jgi:hypothetical protein
MAMALVLQIVAGVASLVCFIMVIMAMFQHNQTGLGVACIVLIFCGVGGLVAFVYGWVKAKEWNLMNIMLVWTGAFAIGIIGAILQLAAGPPLVPIRQ